MASPAELQLITNKMAAAVARCTRDLRFAWVSRQCAEWIRRPADAIVGRKIQDVLGTEAFQRLLPHFERVLSGETVTYEDRVAYSNFGEKWISATYTPTLDSSGNVDGWVAVICDITDQKLAEGRLLEQERQMAEEATALAKLHQCSLRLWQTTHLKEGLAEMLRAPLRSSLRNSAGPRPAGLRGHDGQRTGPPKELCPFAGKTSTTASQD
jgi:PAS domain S-box-containing protein